MSARAWPQPDFMPAPRRPAWLMWPWLAVALLVSGLLAAQTLSQRAEADQLDEQAALLDRLAAQAKPRAAPAKPSAANVDVQRRAWAVAAQLDADWRERWLSLEQGWPPGVQLLALEMQGGQDLRIEGLAGEMPPVTALVDGLALQARNVPGTQVELTRLQRVDGSDQLGFEIVRRRSRSNSSTAGDGAGAGAGT